MRREGGYSSTSAAKFIPPHWPEGAPAEFGDLSPEVMI